MPSGLSDAQTTILAAIDPSSKADQAIAYAEAEIGKPYRYGAEGPNAFDCSGLMQWVYAHVGIQLPRTAAAQQRYVTATSSPRAGDLVFWGTPAHHVGLYIGNGKMIAAPRTGSKVQVQKVYGTPSGYGRIPGLGKGSGIDGGGETTGATIEQTGLLSGATSSILSGAENLLYKGGFLLLGVALIGFGVVKLAGPSVKSVAGSVGPAKALL